MHGRKNVPTFTLSWEEGKYFDLWMFPHIFSGFVFGLGLFYFAMSFWIAFVVTVIALTFWEVFEHVFNIYEIIENRLLDVVFGMVGFFVSYGIAVQYLSMNGALIATIISTLILALLSLLGWRAYVKRTQKTN